MPVAMIPLSSTEFSIFNSIYYKIIKDVADRVNIDPETLTVMYKNIEYAKTDNEDTLSILTKDNTPSTLSNRRVSVRVSQEYEEENIGTTATHQEEHYPIFLDKKNRISITPIYIQIEAELEFEYNSPSKTELASMRDMIRIQASRTRNIGHHEVEYTMLIPPLVEGFVVDMYELINRLDPQELTDYFLQNSNNRVHLITDMSNEKNANLGVREKQVRILGTYGFDPLPDKAEASTENNANRFSFTYKFKVTIPRALSIKYPAIVCNKLVPYKYLSFLEEGRRKQNHELDKGVRHIGRSNQALSYFEANKRLGKMVNLDLPINVPPFDDFSLKQGHKGYGIMMTFLITVDEEDNKGLFNLNDMGDYQFSENYLEYIKQDGLKDIVKPYRSILYLGLHQEGRHFDNSILEVTPDLDVRSTISLDLHTPVRVSISICVDLSMLTKEAMSYLKGNQPLLLDFIKEYLKTRNTFKGVVKDNTSNTKYFLNFIYEVIRDNINSNKEEFLEELLTLISESNVELFNGLIKYVKDKDLTLFNSITTRVVGIALVNGTFVLIKSNSTTDNSKIPLTANILAGNIGMKQNDGDMEWL